MAPESKSKKNPNPPNQDNTRPRNESVPGQNPVGTTTSEKIDADNSPDVRDAMNESQL